MAGCENEILYYDLNALKQIPIIQVAEQLDLQVQVRGNNHWCVSRNQEDPSLLIIPEENRFYDIDHQVHGDVIRFTQFVKILSPKDAIEYLAEHFGIERSLTREQFLSRQVTNWEYSKIGLHGDMTVKNFSFPLDEAASGMLHRLRRNSEIPLNTLLALRPDIYQGLLIRNALPFMETLRNSYYRDVLKFYHGVCAPEGHLSNESVLEALNERFSKESLHLYRCERILWRSSKHAGIDLPEPSHQTPDAVISRLLQGELSITLGNSSFRELSLLSERTGCSICEGEISYSDYLNGHLSSFAHTGVFHDGSVFVSYLSSDEPEFLPYIDTFDKMDGAIYGQSVTPGPIKVPEAPGPVKEK